MRITELPVTTEAEQTDFLAVDDSTLGTRRISPDDLIGGMMSGYVSYGIDTVTTEQQANARYNLGIGIATTESEGLVQLYNGVDSTSTTMAATAAAVKLAYENGGGGSGDNPVLVDIASFNSLPKTVSNASITSTMVLIHAELGTPSAMASDWTVTTANGSVTISGTIDGTTTLRLILSETR